MYPRAGYANCLLNVCVGAQAVITHVIYLPHPYI
nr:MAG TPA: hypothetical protein [Caudoviricetes sp.]